MANTLIKIVMGNVLRLNIPLQVKIRNTEQGEPTERTEDFYPSLEYQTIVKLTSDYKTVNLDAEVDGNVVKVEDKGTLKAGCYQIEVICKDDNGNPYRFAEPCVIHVVNYTKDADIEAGVEYEVETYTLEGAYFIKGEKGDKGDPFTWEDFTEEEILLLQKPAQDKANEVTALQEQWTEAETQRAQAETQRAAAEQTRQTAEGQRNTSEQQRQTNEQARSEAETLRQQAESQRQQAFQTAINNAEEATQEAENVNAQLSSDGGVVILTITNRQGNHTSKEVGFRIYKTYPSIAAMNADLANVEEGKFVMIAGSTEEVDTGKLYVRGTNAFTFITDLSGAQGIKGDTGNGIASMTLNADYTLTIVFTDGTSTTTTSIRGEKGEKGEQGDPGTTDYNELENKPDLSGFITISVNNLVNYYLKSETYTKQEVQALIAAIQQFHYEIYASTSDVTSPQGNVLYLIGPTGTGADKYEEYVYANSQFVKIGDTSIDLSGYYTSQQTDSAITQALNTALADYTTTAALTLLLAGKQDVINDLSEIRSGARAGATAYQKPQGGIPSTDMSQGVQTSLGKADSSLQPTQQTLTNEQKQQARNNIDAAGVDDVPTLPNNVSYFSNDSGDGIVPTDGIRGEDIVASSAISVHPDVVTAITGEIGSATTITLVVPNDNLRHVWDIFFTTASDGGATIVVPQGTTLHVPSGYSIASGKTYEVRVIGVGNHYYLSYGEYS